MIPTPLPLKPETFKSNRPFFNGLSFANYSSFKDKKLSTDSPRDFNSVLDTINQYWIDPAK